MIGGLNAADVVEEGGDAAPVDPLAKASLARQVSREAIAGDALLTGEEQTLEVDGQASVPAAGGIDVAETPIPKVHFEFVGTLDELTIDSSKPVTVVKAYGEDEQSVNGGQIETNHLASCIGYALLINDPPNPPRTYVGHFSIRPGKLLWQDTEDFGKLLDLAGEGKVKFFILGGDGDDEGAEVLQFIYRQLEYFHDSDATGIPIFCHKDFKYKRVASDVFYSGDLSLRPILMPKAFGICVDSDTNRVRIALEGKITDEQRAILEKVYNGAP